jgi:heme O synthase-like polyprenyltransferase
MVLITTIVGFYMGSDSGLQLSVLLHTIVGTALVAAGASSLNQYMERDLGLPDVADAFAPAAGRARATA